MRYVNHDFADKRWLHHEPGLIRGALRVTAASIAALFLLLIF